MGFRHFLGVMSPNGTSRPTADDDPFWALVEETGLVMSLHGGGVGARFPAAAAPATPGVATPPVRDQITIAAGRSGGMGVQTTLALFVFSGLSSAFPLSRWPSSRPAADGTPRSSNAWMPPS